MDDDTQNEIETLRKQVAELLARIVKLEPQPSVQPVQVSRGTPAPLFTRPHPEAEGAYKNLMDYAGRAARNESTRQKQEAEQMEKPKPAKPIFIDGRLIY
ncbi:MAG: hypothetical protein K8T91_25755 [Planctomycetes bacterium]|nr:hypothetical protein [Planctomycetota bacterium]